MISKIQKQRITEYLNKGKRFDNRTLEEFRDIKVEMNISENAEGSCALKLGNTEVYCGVKLSIGTPYPDHEDEGTLSTTMELGPMADNNFEMGPPRIGAIEMARVIDRGIRESGFIDFKKLCIEKGEKVWMIALDIYAINNDGNLLDAGSLAALIALANAKLPVYNEEEEKAEHQLSKNPLPINKEAMSFNLTIHKIGEGLVIDPSREEEEISEYRLSIAICENKGEPRITAMQKGKEGTISEEDMEKILKLIEDKYKEQYPKVTKLVFGK